MEVRMSLLLFFTVTLAFISDFETIFANGQLTPLSLEQKWRIEEQGTTFDEAINKFTMAFEVDTSMTLANTRARLYDENCMEGGNELFAADGFDNIASAVPTPGDATLSFEVNNVVLAENTDIFTTLPDDRAEMRVCARFELYTDDGSYEVNFREFYFTIIYDLSAGFEVEAFNVEKVQDVLEEEKDYDVIAYLCDPANPGVELLGLLFNQGALISVCVTPTPEALQDGIRIKTIDHFTWSQDLTGFLQVAIIDAAVANNQLTTMVCVPGSIFCTFSSILFADFYSGSPGPNNENPTVECDDVDSDDEEMNLDFLSSTLLQNDLQNGGEIRYGGVGTIEGSSVDLVVTSNDYSHPNPSNGFDQTGNFPAIGFQTVQGDADSGKANFNLCLMIAGTNTPVTAELFEWAVIDLDTRAGQRPITEKVTIDTAQVSGYSLYPDSSSTEISQTCENDGTPPPCDPGVRTVFTATEAGTAADNPHDPASLTETQKKRTVVFTFTDTDCWSFQFWAHCEFEPAQTCSNYGGSKMFFAGSTPQVIAGGETECPNDARRNLKATNGSDTSSSNDSADETRRDLQVIKQVAGEGVATLTFDTLRRRLDKNGRILQADAGPSADIELVVEIQASDEIPSLLRTAGGVSAWSCLLFVTLVLLVNTCTLLLS